MLTQYFRRAFMCMLVFTIICIFPNWSFAVDGKVHPDVLAVAQELEEVKVIIRLQDQSGHEIAQAVKAQHIPGIDAIAREVRALVRPFHEQKLPLPDDVRQQVKALLEELDSLTMQMRRDIRAQVWARISNEQGRVREAAENAGGTVQAQIVIINAIAAQLPSDAVNQIALLPEVRFIELDKEGGPELSSSVPTIRASSFWDAGYTGGSFDIGIVDNGVDLDHPALISHPGIKRNPDAESRHGTAVTGPVASTDSIHKGVAFGLDKILDASSDLWGDTVAAMEWAITGASDDAEALNLSQWFRNGDYGRTMDKGDPDYSSMGADLDEIIDDYDVLVVKSAGNVGYTGEQYKLTWPADSYNAIVVAGSDDEDDSDRSNDSIGYYSSWGPTPGERKKPDLTAPNKIITTTDKGGGWYTNAVGGTSLAAPHVAGALILAWNHGMWHPPSLKAWLINSAEDKGDPGWDYKWGWGYIDLDAAYNQYDYVMVGSISQGSDKWYSGTMDGGEKVTIAWLKHPNSSLADLDMELYDSDGDLLDRSDSSIDNVEQVKLEEGLEAVSVYVRVHCWVSSGSESFGLAPPSSFQSVPPPPWWPSSAPAKFPLVDKKALQSEKKVFALYSNYPNPFNPETWIPFQLASGADVVIRIYNIEGQLVRTISLGNQPEGIYVTRDKSAFWNGKNDEGNLVSSGVYFYTLFANGKKIGTRKVIMLK